MADPAPAATPPPAADLTGRTLGDFHVLRRLGSGGMGQVYLARQLSLKREVALKLLRDDLAQNDTALKRFQAEAEAVARVSHPNIVQVYAVGEHDGLKFMALEYVEGRNLRDYLARKGPPELPVALAIIRQVALALQRASELGIVHRDVKPENILVTRRGEAKVTDFGLSRLTARDEQPLNLTQSGVALGTPLYMAPEQVRGQPTDHRTDLYSFGVTCYHLLAGQPPFAGATAFEVAMKHVNEEPPPLAAVRPDLPPELCAMVRRLMAKRPEDRYPTAKDLLRDLAKLRDQAGVRSGEPRPSGSGLWSQPLPGGRGSPTPVSTLALPAASRWPGRVLGGLAVAAAVAGGWWLFGRTHRPAPEAATAAGPGLPDARLPAAVPLLSSRERELVARLEKRGLPLSEVVTAGVELGLLQVAERRFADAEATFRRLGREKPEGRPPGRPAAGPPLQTQAIAANLGLGVVFAAQDKAEESVRAFQDAVQQVKGVQGNALFTQFLFDHPALTQAVAESLDRDAANLKVTKLPDPKLERLRSPGTLGRGGKG